MSVRVFSGKLLRGHRLAANKSRMDLAQATEVSYQSVRNWESGKAVPKTDLLALIADLLGIRIDDLFGAE